MRTYVIYCQDNVTGQQAGARRRLSREQLCYPWVTDLLVNLDRGTDSLEPAGISARQDRCLLWCQKQGVLIAQAGDHPLDCTVDSLPLSRQITIEVVINEIPGFPEHPKLLIECFVRMKTCRVSCFRLLKQINRLGRGRNQPWGLRLVSQAASKTQTIGQNDRRQDRTHKKTCANESRYRLLHYANPRTTNKTATRFPWTSR